MEWRGYWMMIEYFTLNHPPGQIRSRPKTRPIGPPKMVVKSKGNGDPGYFREIEVKVKYDSIWPDPQVSIYVIQFFWSSYLYLGKEMILMRSSSLTQVILLQRSKATSKERHLAKVVVNLNTEACLGNIFWWIFCWVEIGQAVILCYSWTLAKQWICPQVVTSLKDNKGNLEKFFHMIFLWR